MGENPTQPNRGGGVDQTGALTRWVRVTSWNGLNDGDACLVEGTIEFKQRKPKWVFKRHCTDTTTGKQTVEVYGGKPGHEKDRVFDADRVSATR